MKVIGYRRNDFEAQANERFAAGTITGFDVYLGYPLEGGEGMGTTRIYMSESRLKKCGYVLAVGDDINLIYDRYGKISGIELL